MIETLTDGDKMTKTVKYAITFATFLALFLPAYGLIFSLGWAVVVTIKTEIKS